MNHNGKRLQSNSNSLTEREYGDLVEMAVIPADVSQATRVRYPVQTDREGFRNPFTREHIVVAALGDSFTDALQLPVEQAWPAQLERILVRARQKRPPTCTATKAHSELRRFLWSTGLSLALAKCDQPLCWDRASFSLRALFALAVPARALPKKGTHNTTYKHKLYHQLRWWFR